MSLTGNGSKSIRRQDVKEQKSIAIGLKKLVMAHKATLGDTGINLTSLVTPTEMSSLGFTNPLSSEILAANLLFYRTNLRIVSSHKGALMDYLAYTVDSSSRITFQGFTAEDGEIFMITFDDNAKTGVQMVDAAPLTATGTLAVGSTDFNVGSPFEVNKYPLSQVGAVLVFRNGRIQFRNPSNGTYGGNYQEVQAGSGLGVIIRFNNAPVGISDDILVVSNGLLVYRPDGSLMAEIENLAGQLDVHKAAIETLTGTPLGVGAPNNVDLKAFGDQVLDHEQRIDALEAQPIFATATIIGPSTFNTTSSSYTNVNGAQFATKVLGGLALAPTTTNDVAFKVALLPAGTYEIVCYCSWGNSTAGFSANIRIFDGTNSIGVSSVGQQVNGTSPGGIITYSAPQTNITFTLQGKAAAGGGTFSIGGFNGSSQGDINFVLRKLD